MPCDLLLIPHDSADVERNVTGLVVPVQRYDYLPVVDWLTGPHIPDSVAIHRFPTLLYFNPHAILRCNVCSPIIYLPVPHIAHSRYIVVTTLTPLRY